MINARSKTWSLIENKWEIIDKMDQSVTFLVLVYWIAFVGISSWSGWLWYKVRSIQKTLDNQKEQMKLMQQLLIQHQTINEHTVDAISYLMVKDGGQWVSMGERGEA